MSATRLIIADSQLGEFATAARSALNRQVPSVSLVNALSGQSGPVYGELRSLGKLAFAGWASEANQWRSLCQVFQNMRGVPASDLLICFCKDRKNLGDEKSWRQATANIRRGLSAYEFQVTDQSSTKQLISPLAVIAQNREPAQVLSKLREQCSASPQPMAGTVAEFRTEQYHINLRGDLPATRLYRAGRIVPIDQITREFVKKLEQQLSEFLVRSVRADGRMTYLYYPSRGTEDLARNNSIRQWMATRALCQMWKRSSDASLPPIIGKNIEFNLRAMYREEGSLGLIVDGPKVKLGAVALAALALRESPFHEQHDSVYRRLLATVESLWTDSGQFRTFYRPADRTDCQNFYPGEALLLWSEIAVSGGNARLVERFWKSFEFYQQWHVANRNPAFIPWHTQAYFNLWRINRDPRLAEAVFLMNDWLLDVQQWETAPCPDCQGRFFDPKRPFGPPHASSTGVYLEGLADAFTLAREVGDTNRASFYRTAIVRGLRSIAQLTFKDDLDMFYVSKRNRLRGGVRTTEYNNVVRIDNVQHCLMAIHKVLDVFSDEDFRAPSS